MSFSLVMLATLFGVQGELAMENVTIISDQESHTVVYNRLRGEANFELPVQPSFFATVMVDMATNYQTEPDSLVNRISLYRAFAGYTGGQSRLTLGKQRVPLGVGRIWNPIDIFNPLNIEAIEVDEWPGTECVRLEWGMALSTLDVTLARDKGAARIKSYFDVADVALVGLVDNDRELDIIGWEVEGEFLATGVELRSEGGHFHDRIRQESYFETIVGAEYGFQNSLNVLLEYKYNDETGFDHLGSIIGYQISMLWNIGILGLMNLTDDSYFLAPSVDYSLVDEMNLAAGCFVYAGRSSSEYGDVANQYYAKFYVHF